MLRMLIGVVWLGIAGLAGAQTVTLNLKNADINALISTVAEVTGKNFIIDPRVKGKVTVVSSQAMDSEAVYAVFLSILQVHGFAAVPSGEVIKIVPDVNAKQDSIPTVDDRSGRAGDEMVTRVVQVDNVAAAQLVPILRPLVPQQGHLAAYPATNVLIISDRADNVDRLVQIIQRIDLVSDAEIELITLQHASAVEVVRILTALNRTRGGAAAAAAGGGGDQPTLVADERTNSVMLGGERSDRLRLRAIISHLDTPLERGGNTHVIYLRYAKAAELVKVLTGVSTSIEADQKGQAPQGSAGSTVNIQADDNSNAIVITAPPDVFRSLQGVIRQLDIRRAQVHIDAVIAEITQGKDAALGLQWRGTNDLSGTGAIGGTSFSGAGATIGNVARNPLSVGDGLSLGYFEGTASIFGTEFLNIGVLLQALAADTATNILATPSLVTLDNQEAEIVVAQNVPFVTGSFTSTGTGEGVSNPFQTIQRQDVGLTLRVTPQINEGNAIQLNLEQEISNVSEAVVPGASDIITNKRSIKTTVLVEDRQMVVLGGLIDESLTENVQKVPLLGDIPLMGNLFKSRSTKKQKRNLMVFIQPAILRDAAVFTETSSGKYNYMRGLQTQARDGGVNLLPREMAPVLNEYPQAPVAPAEDNYKQVEE
ncbi:MAG: type II secretion system secretin GspD [Gammaproteobacteria bacterium]|nr:type II secretion system secretin GspD [Gammaproteobacteria bacterium]